MYIKHAEAILAELNNALNGNGKFYFVIKDDRVVFNYNFCGNNVIYIYENLILFMRNLNHVFYFKFPLEEDYEKFIISIVEKYNIKSYQYYMNEKPLIQTIFTEKYHYPDFKIVFYGKNSFGIYDEQKHYHYIADHDGVFESVHNITMYHDPEYLNDVKKYIMVMDGKEDMRIELGDEIIQLTSTFRPKFID